MKVGELWISLGIKQHSSWNQSTGWLNGLKGAALGIAGYFGLKGIGGAMFGFNSMLETSKNRVAEMLAIARHSTLAAQFGEASQAVDELNAIATKLPGTTEDYVNAFALISGPILSAKGSMKELQEITVSTLAFAKLVGRESGGKLDVATSAREIQRGIDGTSRVTDRLVLKMLEVNGVSMKQFKAMNAHQREQLLNSEKVKKVADDYNQAQAKTFSGQREQLEDRGKKFLAKIGQGIFTGITQRMGSINDWLDKNQAKVDAWAEYASNVVVNLFDYIIEYGGKAFDWLSEHGDAVKSVFITIGVVLGGKMLANAIMFGRAWLPIYGIVYLCYKLFLSLRDSLGDVGAAIVTAFAAGSMLFFLGKAKELLGVLTNIGKTGGPGLGGGSGGGGGNGVGVAGALAMAAAATEMGAAIKDRKDNPGGMVDAFQNVVPMSGMFGGTLDDARMEAARQKDANMKGEMTPTSGSITDMLSSGFMNLFGEKLGMGKAPDYTTTVTNNINVATAKDAADVAADSTKEAMDKTVREAYSANPFLR